MSLPSLPCPTLAGNADRPPIHLGLIAGALLGMFAVPATMAQDPLPRTPAEYLQRMDLDGDGAISLAEYRDYMSRGFRHMDLDGNGILEGAELPVPGARPVHLSDHLEALRRAFQRQDLNGDGYLDVHELAAPPR